MGGRLHESFRFALRGLQNTKTHAEIERGFLQTGNRDQCRRVSKKNAVESNPVPPHFSLKFQSKINAHRQHHSKAQTSEVQA